MRRIFKYNVFIAVVAVALITFSCTEDYEVPGDATEGNDVFLSTSFGIGKTVEIQKGVEMYFDDFSSGGEETTWSFPEESDPTVLTTNERHVKVAFGNPGSYEAKVTIDFGELYYLNGEVSETSVYEGSISFVVLDEIEADFQVSDENGTILTKENDALHQVEAGSDLLFTDLSEGSPSTLTYFFRHIESGQVSQFTVNEQNNGVYNFILMGKYDVTYVPTRTTLNKNYADTISYTSFFEVGPSSKPLLINNVVLSENEARIVFSRAMEDASSCDPAAFDIFVSQPSTIAPMDLGISVTEIATDPISPNEVVLTLSAPIYSSDDFELSYDASKGNLVTLDFMEAPDYNGIQGFFELDNEINTLFDGSFESTAITDWTAGNWGAPWDDGVLWDLSSAHVRSGSKSLKIEMGAGEGSILTRSGNVPLFTAEAGKMYEIGMWSYVENVGDGINQSDLRFYTFPETDWGAGGTFYSPTFVTGKWVYRRWNQSFGTGGAQTINLRVTNSAGTAPVVVYIDDITVREVTERP